ncbi:mismatch repair endonuclease PMS2 isoform X1 [Procambarus clarkii]|uniref:mismatch repair endonuclease PMS2 isoform X1 n=2 Tax=Procambarus clarkii TaxID=6728 RepID=UPI0037444A79
MADLALEADEATSTSDVAKSIKPIDKTTVHRICSGQVVLTLATAVKELVENGLDAGATSVEVRLRYHGTTLLEVSDNGKGVEERDFEGLTLKHHTSKIQDFGDLVGVKTYGFRGEALSSLCALSDLTVTTRHTSQEVGTKLVYDHNGKLVTRTPVSRQVGTTVSLQGLFSTLPVRHKEFHRNIKKEFSKMVQVLYSYCLISTEVRITCTNHTDKGKKSIVVSTSGHSTVKENISSIFGVKQVSSLLELQQESASSDVLAEYGVDSDIVATQENTLFTLEGYVSSCAHGQGRSAADRQFYFINSRPCDPARVTKVVNEVYHHYNRHQFPCVVLNIRLKEDDVDINVTPDKRQILINNEKLLLATIKTSLIRLYENIPSSYSMQNTSMSSPLSNSFNNAYGSPKPAVASPLASTMASTGKVSALSQRFGHRPLGSPTSEVFPPSQGGLKRSLSYGFSSNSSPNNKQPKLTSFLKKSKLEEADVGSCDETSAALAATSSLEGIQPLSDQWASEDRTEETVEEEEEDSVHDMGLEEKENRLESVEMEMSDEVPVACQGNTQDNLENSLDFPNTQDLNDLSNSKGPDESHWQSDADNHNHNTNNNELEKNEPKSECLSNNTRTNLNGISVLKKMSTFSRSLPTSLMSKKAHNATNEFLSNLLAKKSGINGGKNVSAKCSHLSNEHTNDKCEEVEIVFEDLAPKDAEDLETPKEDIHNTELPSRKVMLCEDYNASEFTGKRKSKQIIFSLETLRARISASKAKAAHEDIIRKFRAAINPMDNAAAEDELRKEISKDMFAKMKILGQFNLGFIIVCLGSDLFIVDQHATDEKYNFEILQQTCTLQNQRLIIPQTLELTAVNESILLDNIEIFKKNGFEFKVEEDKPVGRRVALVSMPFSRGWEFGREDIEELIFMLSDAPGIMCRPSRVQAMFASRACRKSVMIGTALTHTQMQKLVCHMGEIEQPWNCPHGRPTMRHLINLDIIAAPR